MVIALTIGCFPMPPEPGLDPEVIVMAGVKPAALHLGRLRWEAGLSEWYWNMDRQGPRSARIWIPETPRPGTIVLLLHGAIVTGPGLRDTGPPFLTKCLINCLAEPALRVLDPLIIAPHSADGQWWKKGETEFVLGLVVAARQRWPELINRTVIMGYSNGGIAAWYFARLYPEYFSAAIPIAFNETIVGPSPLPIYAIQGDQDELFSIESVRDAIHKLKAEGADLTFDEKYRTGHLDACAYERNLALAGRWLEQHAFPKALRLAAAASRDDSHRQP